MIKIKWFGHSFWQIKSDEAVIITDPFTDIGYNMNISPTADIVLSSHDHFDHNNIELIAGDPIVIRKPGKYYEKGITIEMFPTWHDKQKGKQRGSNLLMKFTIESKNFLHCGDLGHIPDENIISSLGKIDVLLVPVGGIFTIDAAEAHQLIDIIKPEIIFPMHYNTPALNFDLAPLHEFLALFQDYKKFKENEIELEDNFFAADQQIIVMNYE
jgi:L-ascorbate metabolism protein UlaG (beta-lactamase superfamily)